MKLVLLLTIIVISLAGDTRVPAEAIRVDIDPACTLYYTVLYNQTLIINVNTTRISYFGLGYRYGMSNVPMSLLRSI